MIDLYNSNQEFKEYVDTYAEDNYCTVEEALTHKMVQIYGEIKKK